MRYMQRRGTALVDRSVLEVGAGVQPVAGRFQLSGQCFGHGTLGRLPGFWASPQSWLQP